MLVRETLRLGELTAGHRLQGNQRGGSDAGAELARDLGAAEDAGPQWFKACAYEASLMPNS
jgi:hypothetical protein